MSFLDAICCGFGAIILLFIIVATREPIRLEQSQRDLDGLIAQYEQELNEILGETEQRAPRGASTTVDDAAHRPAATRGARSAQLERIRAAGALDRRRTPVSRRDRRAGSRPRSRAYRRDAAAARRLPAADSTSTRSAAFPSTASTSSSSIDTSGSMKQYEWDRVQQQLRETLEVYPTVKGIQVHERRGRVHVQELSGRMDSRHADAPASDPRRAEELGFVLELEPARGHPRGDRHVLRPEKKISLYVYSDDFSRGSINAIVREIDRRNHADANGNRLVRIHAVAFPTVYHD